MGRAIDLAECITNMPISDPTTMATVWFSTFLEVYQGNFLERLILHSGLCTVYASNIFTLIPSPSVSVL